MLKVTQLSLIPRSRAEARCPVSLTSLDPMEENSTFFVQRLAEIEFLIPKRD